MNNYISIRTEETDPIVGCFCTTCGVIYEIVHPVDRIWSADVRKPDIGWTKTLNCGPKNPNQWFAKAVHEALQRLECEYDAFACVNNRGETTDRLVVARCRVKLRDHIDYKSPQKAQAAIEYLAKHQPKMANGILILGDLLIREDIWEQFPYRRYFAKRVKSILLTPLSSGGAIPKKRAIKPKANLVKECQRLGVALGKSSTEDKWCVRHLPAGSPARIFFALLGKAKGQFTYRDRSSGPAYPFRGFLRPADPGFAGRTLADFMTEDSTPPPGRMVVIGTNRIGDALTLNTSSATGEVYWFEHERGEHVFLEEHLADFLAKCRLTEQK
jgi:hypothetical protein